MNGERLIRLAKSPLVRVGTAICAVAIFSGKDTVDFSQGCFFANTRFDSTEHLPSALKEEIEQQFNIELKTEKDLYLSEGEALPMAESDTESTLVTVWDKERLEMLRSFLEILPPQLYASDSNGNKLRLTLVSFGSQVPYTCTDSGCVYKHEASLGTGQFDPRYPTAALRDLAHELSHVATPTSSRIEKSTTPYGEIKEVQDFSIWFDEINNILGGDFKDLRLILLAIVQERLIAADLIRLGPIDPGDIHFEERKPQPISDNFYFRFLYGLSKPVPSEFIAVAGEQYLYGRDYFLEKYGEFFPQEVVSKLYDFVKGNIYRGWEYHCFTPE